MTLEMNQVLELLGKNTQAYRIEEVIFDGKEVKLRLTPNPQKTEPITVELRSVAPTLPQAKPATPKRYTNPLEWFTVILLFLFAWFLFVLLL